MILQWWIVSLFTIILLHGKLSSSSEGSLSSSPSIIWNITAYKESKNQKRPILHSVCGASKRGRLHAIIGPSGSGKSTLLNALAKVIPKGSMSLEGSYFNEEHRSIYIQQEDVLFAQLTTEETLQTSYDLSTKNPNSTKSTVIINQMLNDLGLKKVAKSKVGDLKTRGLSGGEKKRLCIGNEIISDGQEEATLDATNEVIFADEPTSGLDCFQAMKVIQLLQNLAKKGNTVMFSIHQPRASIYALFDDITLLSEGRVIFTGPVSDMVGYFASQGYPCPNNINPAEFYVDLVSIDLSSPEAEEQSRERILTLAEAFQHSSYFEYVQKALLEKTDSNGKTNNVSHYKRKTGLGQRIMGLLHKVRILHTRAWRQVTRDKPLNIARFCSSLFSSLLFGAIYFKMGKGVGTIPDRLGLLQVAAVNTAMSALIKATTSFVLWPSAIWLT